MANNHSEEDDFSSDSEEVNPLLIRSDKRTDTHSDFFGDESEEEKKGRQSEDDQDDEGESTHQRLEAEIVEDSHHLEHNRESSHVPEEPKKTKKLNRINKLKLAKKSKHKTGVIYLSSIPPYMKPTKMRQILSRFGEIDRLFLRREDEKTHRQRVRSGGNKKVMYVEGWAEFIRKRDAKLCAETLNGNMIGGKKGSFYHDDIMNLKYLPGFKWADLTDQIARENDIKQAKLDMEISQANKVNAEFTRNVEKSKMLHNMKNSKKRKNEGERLQMDNEPDHKTFKQRKVASSRADAPESIKKSESSKDLGMVLSNLL